MLILLLHIFIIKYDNDENSNSSRGDEYEDVLVVVLGVYKKIVVSSTELEL